MCTYETPLIDQLEEHHVPFHMLPHTRTETAAAEAEVLDVPPGEVAKTVVLSTAGGFVRAVVPASRRIDMAKLRWLVADAHATLSTEQALAGAYPEFELGAVPPVGGPRDRVIVDRHLCEHEWVTFEAGSHEESVRVRTADLLTVAGAEVDEICAVA